MRHPKLSELKPGMRVWADDGFDCMEMGWKTVDLYKAGNSLYVSCSWGRHFLNAQEDENGNLVGLFIPDGPYCIKCEKELGDI